MKRKIYRLKIKTCSGAYQGDFFSPSLQKRLPEVINKIEGYLNLKDVVVPETGEKLPFVMINKNSIETIILVKEMVEDLDSPQE
jgi:hypothetical protein